MDIESLCYYNIDLFLSGTINKNLIVYHRKAFCIKKEPNRPGAEGGREARSY